MRMLHVTWWDFLVKLQFPTFIIGSVSKHVRTSEGSK